MRCSIFLTLKIKSPLKRYEYKEFISKEFYPTDSTRTTLAMAQLTRPPKSDESDQWLSRWSEAHTGASQKRLSTLQLFSAHLLAEQKVIIRPEIIWYRWHALILDSLYQVRAVAYNCKHRYLSISVTKISLTCSDSCTQTWSQEGHFGKLGFNRRQRSYGRPPHLTAKLARLSPLFKLFKLVGRVAEIEDLWMLTTENSTFLTPPKGLRCPLSY